MPRVTRARETVQERPLGTPQLQQSPSASAFGADIGRAAQAVSSGLLGLAKKQKDQADLAAVEEFSSQIIKRKNRLQYGDPNEGVEGFMAVQGKAANGLLDTVPAELQNFGNELIGRLSPDQQRSANRILRQQMRSLDGSLNSHIFQQNKIYEAEAERANINANIEDAALNYNDPQVVADAKAGISQTILAGVSASETGQEEAPAVVAERIKDANSKVDLNIIRNMSSNGDYDKANEYFKGQKSEMTQADREQADRLVKSGNLLSFTQKKSDEIFGRFDDEADGLDFARKNLEGDKRKFVVASLRDRYSERRRVEQQQSQDAADSAMDILEDPANTISDIDAQLWNEMDAEQRDTVVEYAQTKANGFAQASDQDVIDMVSDMSVTDKQQFLQEDLTKFRSRLTRTDYNMLRNAQRQARAGTDQNDLQWVRSRSQTLNDVMLQAGIPKNEKVASEFIGSAVSAWDNFRATNGRDPTELEFRDISNKLASKIYINNTGIFGSNFNRDESRLFQVGFDDIPGREKNQIEIAFQNKGLVHVNDPNPQNLPTYDDDDVVAVFIAGSNQLDVESGVEFAEE